MTGAPIDELNAGLKELQQSLAQDALACLRVEIALVSFSSAATVDMEFTTPKAFAPPALKAWGSTALGSAVLKGLELVQARSAHYRTAGVPSYRPWIVVVTDGEATDSTAEAARQVRDAEARNRLCFFGVGVKGANLAKLAELSLRPPLPLDGLRFADLFQWLSASLSSVAVSRPGDQVPLPPPNWSAA